MTNIGDSSHIIKTSNSNDQALGNTSPLTELNTSPQKDPFDSTPQRVIGESEKLDNNTIALSPSDSRNYQSDSSSELSEINSEAETEKMDLPEGSELKAIAEFMAEQDQNDDELEKAEALTGVKSASQEPNAEDDGRKTDSQVETENGRVKEESDKDALDGVVSEADKDEKMEEEGEDGKKDIEMEEEEREQHGGGDEDGAGEDDEEDEEDDEDDRAERESQLDPEELARLREEKLRVEEEKKAIEAEKQKFRQAAVEDLTAIEIDYAKLKDALYHNQLSKLEYELKLCLNGSHPDFIRILNKVNDNYDRKIKTLVMSQNYKLDCINNQTKATRYQVHQQYLKNCQDLKLRSIEETTTKWYEINKERRMMDQIPYNNKKRVRDSDNKSILFNEIGRLNKVQRSYGFPSGISNLASADDDEIEEDLFAMKRAFQL